MPAGLHFSQGLKRRPSWPQVIEGTARPDHWQLFAIPSVSLLDICLLQMSRFKCAVFESFSLTSSFGTLCLGLCKVWTGQLREKPASASVAALLPPMYNEMLLPSCPWYASGCALASGWTNVHAVLTAAVSRNRLRIPHLRPYNIRFPWSLSYCFAAQLRTSLLHCPAWS